MLQKNISIDVLKRLKLIRSSSKGWWIWLKPYFESLFDCLMLHILLFDGSFTYRLSRTDLSQLKELLREGSPVEQYIEWLEEIFKAQVLRVSFCFT